MKMLVASDIHGSSFYCNKLINAFKKENADRLILLGDLLYHGPRNDLPQGYSPKEVIEILNPLSDKIICVRGNCDAEVDQMVLNFPIMSDYLLINDNDTTYFVTHGHIFNSEITPKINKKYILLHGHTHIPACDEHERFIYINPGSVSIPKANSVNSYILIENDIITWKDLDGNIIKIKNLKNNKKLSDT